MVRTLTAVVIFGCAMVTAAEDMVLRGTSIKAMDGLPTVTFVVPWQQSSPVPYIGPPPNSVMDDVLLPVDSSLLPVITIKQLNKSGIIELKQ